ncbi:MarR family winged helix-turn-helix transcriptional regulator [uncultured Azohydromonas sp.]|jgi:Transcriptional regulators|uniref:MarR family winged helix-turn-helix transcriptional regulator n=1 Tax=uncultured Azohydromonas sp. TaxID=487342 RepID=UPI0026165D1A|nr:MarR family winged helix-turn-helix transcriptional regulator [uncultured Azohydromonas sp.]
MSIACKKPVGKPPQSSDKNELAAEVLRQFRQVFNAVKTHFQHVEKKVGLGGAQVWALSVIRDTAGIRVSELAQAMDIHQSTASNLVKGLIEKGLISAERDGPDKRVVRLKLQTAGAKALRAAPGPFEGVLPSALQSLDVSTLERLNADLGGLVTVLNADEHGAKVPLAEM